MVFSEKNSKKRQSDDDRRGWDKGEWRRNGGIGKIVSAIWYSPDSAKVNWVS